ncbi:AI-2E family transporter [Arthrobacter sp. zg-Y1110]|uniref:AI-2E family transporter n=1 Tax=Arthrobacter sp. zg-Y1110 TaxID=2886932 RepID=UPI001D1526DD|nr:AI-2E family transporter [Arthrobacter sp. zg-Y1110]MCC3291168.1 AI-2E family transporter [Arthrobacter sp. zg-Y1110]UWX83601.1 AI-2E family transporter [Arthrobacter sp. zg-Y1110]
MSAGTAETGPAAAVPAFPRSAVILLTLAGAAIAAFGLAAVSGIFTPAFLALVLTLCVHPLRQWLQRRGIPRGLATGSAIAAVFALLAGFAAVLVAALAQFSALLPQFAPQIAQAGASISSLLTAAGFGAEQVQAVEDSFNPGRLIGFVSGLLGNVTNLVTALVIILTLLILMAVDGSRTPALLIHLRAHRPALVSALEDFASGVRRYMVATTVLGVAQGLFNWLVLVILDVPGALLWGLLSFICSFIPNVGYFIAIVPPLFFGYLTGGWPTVAVVVIVFGGINAVVQSIVQPRYVGNAVNLSETLTFISVLFWAVVLGPVGAILAVPLTLLTRTILLDSDPSLSWWRAATGDRKDLDPLLAQEDAAIRARRGAGRPRRGDAPAA